MTLTLDMPETLSVEQEPTTAAEIPDLESLGQQVPIQLSNGHDEAASVTPEFVAAAEIEATTSITCGAVAVDGECPACSSESAEVSVTIVDNPSEIELKYGRAIEAKKNEIRNAEEHLGDCSIREARLKGELKWAKESRAEAAESLRILREELKDLIEDGPQPEPVAADEQSAEATPAIGDATTLPAADPSTAVAIPPEPDHWRTAPVSLLKLKPALETRLTEHGIETVGALEDLRAKGNEKGVGLRSIKGVGDAKVTEIEDAVIAWLSKNRDAAVLAEAGKSLTATTWDKSNASTEGLAETAGAVIEHAEQATSSPPTLSQIEPPGLTSTTTPAGIAKHDPDAIDYQQVITDRAKRINDGLPSCLDKKLKGDPFWEWGQAAYEGGLPMTECNVPQGSERDDWLRGWMGAQSLDEYDTGGKE